MSDNKTPLQGFFFRDFANSWIPTILKETWIDGIYNFSLIGKRDLTIIDVGANLGITSYFFKDFAKIVYALEPSSQHREAFSKMIEFNKIDNVILIPKALSNENGKTSFYINPYNNTAHSLEPMLKEGKLNFSTEEVETITFDKLFEELKLDKVDFCKLDVEGSEGKILTSEGFKKVAPKIDSMIIEYHNWSGISQSNLEHCIQDLGFVTGRLKNDASLISAIRI